MGIIAQDEPNVGRGERIMSEDSTEIKWERISVFTFVTKVLQNKETLNEINFIEDSYDSLDFVVGDRVFKAQSIVTDYGDGATIIFWEKVNV